MAVLGVLCVLCWWMLPVIALAIMVVTLPTLLVSCGVGMTEKESEKER